MAQTVLAEVLRHYRILTPYTPDVNDLNDELLQEFELIPQGIPALYEYSERFARDRRAKELVNTFLNLTGRHSGTSLDVRFAPIILVLVYLSRPMISSMLSSLWESTSRISRGTAPRPHHPNYVTKATQTCDSSSDHSTETDSEQQTVTFTVAEMLWMQRITSELLGNQEVSKTRQADMLTAIGDLEDANEALGDDVARLESEIRALKRQRAVDEDTKRRLSNERESYRLGGKDFKKKWEEVQKEYNDLEDDRDDCVKMIQKLQDNLEEMTVQRDDLKKEAQLAAVREVSSEGLDAFESGLGTEESKELGSAVKAAGSQIGVKEDTPEPITQPMTLEQSKVEIRKLKKELDELKAVHNTPEPSRDTSRAAIFEQPQGLIDNNVEEGASLRRTQSAPLWLPLPDHDDTFDSLFDGSDYGDDDDQVEDTTPLPEDVPLPNTPPNDGLPITPEPSPRRVSPSLNVAAPAFIPTIHPTRPSPLRAMGPEDTRNPHIKKINEGLKRQTWMEKSGEPDPVEGKKGVAIADEVIDDMYDRQVGQFLKFKPIECARGSMWGALNDISNRLDGVSTPAKNDDDADEASSETQHNSDAHSSISQEGHEEHGEDDGEWSDAEDEDCEKNGAVVPMMGRYQVTCGPKNAPKDYATPMLGSHKVTHGPKPTTNSSKESQTKPTVYTKKANENITPAHCESGAPKDEEDPEAAEDWTDVADGTDEEIQDEDSPEEDGGMPILGNYKVTRDDAPSDSDHEASEAEKESGHESSPPVAGGTSTEEVSRQDVTTPVPESQSAGPSTLDSDVTDQVDDAAVSRATPQDVTTPVPESQSTGPSTSDSDTTDQLEDAAVSRASPQDVTTPVQVPQPAKTSTSDLGTTDQLGDTAVSRAPPQDVTTPVRGSQSAGPSTTDSDTIGQPGDAAVSRAPPQGPSSPSTEPKPQPPPGAPTGPRAHTSRNPSPKPSDSDLPTSDQSSNPNTTPKVHLPTPQQCGIDNQDPTPRVRLPQQPIRNQTPSAPVTPSTQEELDSNTSSQRAIFHQPPRTSLPPSTPANQGSPPQDPSAASPSRSGNSDIQNSNPAPPTGPAAGIPNRSPRGNARGGRGGRGAHQTHQTPAQNVPAKGSIPRGPAAGNTTNNTPSRQSGRGRGSGSAADSFLRFQERMAREKGS